MIPVNNHSSTDDPIVLRNNLPQQQSLFNKCEKVEKNTRRRKKKEKTRSVRNATINLIFGVGTWADAAELAEHIHDDCCARKYYNNVHHQTEYSGKKIW